MLKEYRCIKSFLITFLSKFNAAIIKRKCIQILRFSIKFGLAQHQFCKVCFVNKMQSIISLIYIKSSHLFCVSSCIHGLWVVKDNKKQIFIFKYCTQKCLVNSPQKQLHMFKHIEKLFLSSK